SGDEEVLLAQAQLLARLGAVGRVKHSRDAFRTRLLGHRADVVTGVEALQMEIPLGPCPPQPQGVHAGGAPTDDGRVVGDRPHALGPVPEMPGLAFGTGQSRYAAAEADQVADLRPLE